MNYHNLPEMRHTMIGSPFLAAVSFLYLYSFIQLFIYFEGDWLTLPLTPTHKFLDHLNGNVAARRVFRRVDYHFEEERIFFHALLVKFRTRGMRNLHVKSDRTEILYFLGTSHTQVIEITSAPA